MNGLYELHFHGNRQEIEKEKLRKRELMSYFPKTLGTVDETKYVLQDDDKPKQTDYFESKPVSPLTPPAPSKNEPMPGIGGIGGLQSEKPKKDDNGQTMAQGLADWGNKENPLGFGNWKSASTLFSLQKEKNETKAPESPFDFDGNTAKEENIPFNHGIQFPGLGAVGGNQPRTTAERNDSLALESKEIERIADSLKTVNVNNTNAVPNNAPTEKPDIISGLYGENPDRDYTEDLRKIKQNLPPVALNILNNSGTEFFVLKNMQTIDENGKRTPRIGRYYADENKVYLDSKHVNEYTLLSEAIHVVQDYLGMTGIGKSNLEFQEHVIKDLYYSQKLRKKFGDDALDLLSASTGKEYVDLIANIFDSTATIDLKTFLSGIEYCIGGFQEHYNSSDSYQSPKIKNFDYNWSKLFDIFGIEYK